MNTATIIAAAAGLRARVWELAGRRLGPREAGSVTVWVVITTAAILAVAALVADSGARIRAGERADIIAGEAARAASYAAGADERTRLAAAVSAAQTVISRSGASGTASITGPGQVQVAVTASALGPISGLSYPVTRTVTGQLLVGVRTGGTP